MANLYVPLRREELDKLVDLALLERRRPQDQAAVLLAKAIAEATAARANEAQAPVPA